MFCLNPVDVVFAGGCTIFVWGGFANKYSGIYLKRLLHTDFNSYVVGTERETKDLHLELSLQICSCARHMVQ
jgi:hypothetical protein